MKANSSVPPCPTFLQGSCRQSDKASIDLTQKDAMGCDENVMDLREAKHQHDEGGNLGSLDLRLVSVCPRRTGLEILPLHVNPI